MKLLLTFFSLLLACNSYAQLLIAPTRVDVDATKNTTKKIIIENTSQEPVRVEIVPTYMSTVSSDVVRNNPDIESVERITEKIRVSPPVIRKLDPGQRRTIRIQILPSHTEGEHRSYLKFTPTKLTTINTVNNQDSESSNFNLGFRIHTYIPIYQTNGKPKENVIFKCNPNNLAIENKDKFQFNATLETSTGEIKNILLFRESTMTIPKKNAETVFIKNNDRIIHQCK
ncbi:hypothetical protein [Vibrio scophthalmi]|uniref:Pili assembly chaperone N-terminal domain-containing protein n=2 Tax=Vibrio scophthalmi TaxID=45658 RepID=A0A1C7FG99_9VIBR|nr:hypothetical protein [Vibrio scophthalmi]ANU38364.1 hypothetical protein VSVS05_03326 [Vibrio scophthalmi]